MDNPNIDRVAILVGSAAAGAIVAAFCLGYIALFLLLGRRACRRDHGNAKKCCNSNAERNHDRSSPLARQPQRASTESFAFASLIVIATSRCAVTGATRACA